MRAAVLDSPGRIVVAAVPDPRIECSSDAVVRIVAAGICGTDLRAYQGRRSPVNGPRCGHEFLGIVEYAGPDVRRARPGTMVVAPFMYVDGTCPPCRRDLPASCHQGGMWGGQTDGGQAEAVRVPFADATLVPVPMDEHDERLPAVLSLSDVMATGQHAVQTAGMMPGASIAVVGDGAVGLCTVLAAVAAGAEQVFLLGHHPTRGLVGQRFGASRVVNATGDEAAELIREATGGTGVDLAVDCVGSSPALETALAICADGGTVSIVGGSAASFDTTPMFLRNIALAGGLTPARHY